MWRYRFLSGLFSSSKRFGEQERAPQFEYLYGVSPVEAAVHAKKRILNTLFISDSDHVEIRSAVSKLILHAKDNAIPLVFTAKDKLSRMVSGQPHQNIVLKCSPIPIHIWSLNDKHGFGVYVFCDKISDPQNLGSIFRSSLFFGIKNIFKGRKDSCPLNETVCKTSAGALEFMNTVIVDKSEQFMKKWKEDGGAILVTSIDSTKNLIPIQNIAHILEADKIGKVLVVMGSQGAGVSPHLQRQADFFISVKGRGNLSYPENIVDSLNVNAALSIVLYELTKSRMT